MVKSCSSSCIVLDITRTEHRLLFERHDEVDLLAGSLMEHNSSARSAQPRQAATLIPLRSLGDICQLKVERFPLCYHLQEILRNQR